MVLTHKPPNRPRLVLRSKPANPLAHPARCDSPMSMHIRPLPRSYASAFLLDLIDTTFIITDVDVCSTSVECHNDIVLLDLANVVFIILLSTCLHVVSMWAIQTVHGSLELAVALAPSLNSPFTTAWSIGTKPHAYPTPLHGPSVPSLACPSLLSCWSLCHIHKHIMIHETYCTAHPIWHESTPPVRH